MAFRKKDKPPVALAEVDWKAETVVTPIPEPDPLPPVVAEAVATVLDDRLARVLAVAIHLKGHPNSAAVIDEIQKYVRGRRDDEAFVSKVRKLL